MIWIQKDLFLFAKLGIERVLVGYLVVSDLVVLHPLLREERASPATKLAVL